jgi:hypothetical protein
MSMMSPELALVDPELRALAVAVLPRVRPFEFLELRPLPPVEPVAAVQAFRLSAAVAYLAVAIVRTFAFDAVVLVIVAVCVLLAALFG